MDKERDIRIVDGDIFESGADVILHQVNCQGVMGSGVAKQVREKYPWVYGAYIRVCESYGRGSNLLGVTHTVNIDETRLIINLFSQDNYGYDGKCYTDYNALKQCLARVNYRQAGKSVAIPYLMGCHRGGGDWSVVSKIIEDTLVDCDVTFYRYTAG